MTDEKRFGVTGKAVVLNAEGKILALHRTKTAPTGQLQWDLPGGRLEFGEHPIDGLIREIREETGLEVAWPRPYDVYAKTHPDGHWVSIGYVTQAKTTDVQLSYEHDEFKWVTKEEFLKLDVGPKIRQFLQNLK
jgi:8-oxo-dGTP diphosphatase